MTSAATLPAPVGLTAATEQTFFSVVATVSTAKAPSGVDDLGHWTHRGPTSLEHFASSILAPHEEAIRGGRKRRSLFVPFLRFPGTWSGTAEALCPHQVFQEAGWYACCPRGWAPRASGYGLHGHLGTTPGAFVSFPGDLQAHRSC